MVSVYVWTNKNVYRLAYDALWWIDRITLHSTKIYKIEAIKNKSQYGHRIGLQEIYLKK